jgi:aldehyde:ferredoxin oxidoreductase
MCPLIGFMGVELKLTGFDFVVITGKANQEGYVWIRDGIVEFVPSPGMNALESWERTDRIRSDQGDGKIQVIAGGPRGQQGLATSQLIMNYWGGEDTVGMAAELARIGLSAVAFRGMGELELNDSEGHLSRSSALMRSQLSSLGTNDGLASFSEMAARDDFRELLHRNVGCYACPFPCRSYYKVRESPGVMALENREPGYLAYDIPAVEMMTSMGMSARETVESLMLCARRGAEPIAAMSATKARGGTVDAAALEAVLSSSGSSEPWKGPLTGGFEGSFDDKRQYEMCLSLGLCPRYWARAGFDRDSIVDAAEPALGAKLDLG